RATTSITIDVLGPVVPALRSPADGTLTYTNALTLTWSTSPSPDVAGYRLDWSAGQVDVGDTTVFTTGLLTDGVYTWTVAAYDGVGHTSDYTDTWSFTVDTTPPQPPGLFSPADGAITADTTPTLVWTPSASPDVAGYWLNFDGTEMDVGNIVVSTTGVLADGIYTWTVAAYDELGHTSAYSDVWSFTVDTLSPQPPALVSPADNAVISDTTPTLTWQASPSPDVVGYLLDLNGHVSNVGNVTAYATDSLTDGTYTWTLAAYDGAGYTSAFTDTWTFSVDTTPPSPPVLVSPAHGLVVSDTTPTLVWQASASPDVASYLLDLNGNINDVGDVTSYTAPLLADGAYAWRVAAYDDVGNTGVYSDVWTFGVDATPPQVVAVSPPAGAQGVAVDVTIVITFSEAVNTASLDYAVLPDPLGWSAVWRDGETVVVLDHNAFAPETTYTVSVVAAADGVGNSLSGAPYVWHFATASQWVLYLPLVLKSH
ncbi:MAG: Ig-like domain-containing protein, partial [Anaerolineae bacterium]